MSLFKDQRAQILIKLFPSLIKEVFHHVPTHAFKLVKWHELGIKGKNLSKQLVKKEYKQEIDDELENLLFQKNLKITLDHNGLSPDSLTEDQAQSILEFYFIQFLNPYGAYLDLRHWGFSGDNPKFYASPFWYQWEDDFRHSLLELYQGYYFQDEARFSQALKTLGLTQGLSESLAKECQQLFYDHFKNPKKVKFSLNEFNESFMKIFSFFLENSISLPTDFLFLGYYLITLYMSLEKYPDTLNVEKAFLKIFPKKE